MGNGQILAQHRSATARCPRLLDRSRTKDTGFSLTQLTFQITHATDADTNAERDFIIAELRNNQVIGDASEIQAGQHIEHVNHYVTDGEIALANL